jgi:hypothetical protein
MARDNCDDLIFEHFQNTRAEDHTIVNQHQLQAFFGLIGAFRLSVKKRLNQSDISRPSWANESRNAVEEPIRSLQTHERHVLTLQPFGNVTKSLSSRGSFPPGQPACPCWC